MPQYQSKLHVPVTNADRIALNKASVWKIAFGAGGSLTFFLVYASYYLNQLPPAIRERLLQDVFKLFGW